MMGTQVGRRLATAPTILIVLFLFTGAAQAADFFVRSNATGNGSGSDWTNAWNDMTNIVWSSIQPGDTIWISGGSYGELDIGASGNADTNAGRIFIKRATGLAHGSDTGWVSTFDTLVTISGMNWTALNLGSYVTVDGQVDAGILIPHGDGTGSTSVFFERGNSYVTLRHLDLAGPGDLHSHHHTGDDRSLRLTAYNGSSYDLIDHLTVQYVRIHGTCTAIWNMHTTNAVYEYNQIYNVFDDNGAVCHPDVFVTSSSSNLIFRYNQIYNWEDEDIMFLNGDNGTHYIYGNLWYGETNTNARIMESQMGANGPVFFYNNTIDRITAGFSASNGGSWAPGSQSRNNIWWGVGCGTDPSDGFSDTDYDFTSVSSCSGSHSVTSGANPFVNLSGANYHLASATPAGQNLGAPYNVDPDGNIRGADGVWDIGAYEFNSGTPPPPPPSGPLANVYISQAGGGSGSSCGAAAPVSFFNMSGNWGTNSGQIGPDTVVHLCGTITSQLTWGGNGTAGHPVILDGTGATMNAELVIATLSYWTIQNVTWSASFSGGSLNTSTLDLQGSANGVITGNTFDVAGPGTLIFLQQSNSASSLSHDIIIQNNFFRNGAIITGVQSDLLDTEGSYNITVQGNYFEMRAQDNSQHDDCIQTWQKGGVTAGPPHDWTVRYNKFVMNSTAPNNKSWMMMEMLGAGTVNIYGNVYVGLQGASSANGIVFDSNQAGMTANIYGNTIVEKAGANNNLFNLGAPGTFNLSGNIIYSSDSGNALTGGGPVNRDHNLWYGANVPACVATEICGHNPLFTNYATNDFSLQSGSPARGVAANQGVTYNQYPLPGSTWPNPALGTRSASGNWDAGAYQFSGAPPPPNNPPTASITSPANGATFIVGSNLTINATAADSDGTVTKVEFYQGTTLLGTDLSGPYSFNWTNLPAGTYSLTAKAYDNLGATGTSTAVTITVNPPNQAPTVSVTSPANGATFTTPATITINATAADSDGTVTKVDFFEGSTLLGTDVASPYTFSWANVPAGTYSLTARATDNQGAATTSSVITVTVSAPANQPPTASITSPADGATFTAPALITINGTAADSDGTVVKVEFYQGTTLLGTDVSAPYTFNWTNVPAGSYTLTIKAYDNLGATTDSQSVNIGVDAPANQAPTVSLASPANGATFTAPGSITINATAADSDGTVTKVDFFQGSTLLGTDASSPYTFNWTLVPAGTYSLTARATDNQGATTTSGAVTVTVTTPANQPPTASITSPANGATFVAGTNLTISATATDVDGTITKVEFYQGTTLLGTDTTPSYSFNWNNVPAGSYSLTVKAYDNLGATGTSAAVPITVSAHNQPPIASITSPIDGATFSAPGNITITATASDPDGTVAQVDFFQGNTLLATKTVSPYTFSWTPVPAGTYRLTARATDNQGAQATSAAVAITVTTPNSPPPPPNGLAVPALNLPETLPIDGTIQLSNASSFSNTSFTWSFAPQAGSGTLGLFRSKASGVSAAVSATSQAPQLSLSSVPNLVPGTYEITVQASGNGQTTQSVPVMVTLVLADLSAVKVYPNPWRSDKHAGKNMVFGNLPANCSVKIFTVSGHLVRDLGTVNGQTTWDVSNESGDKVASGIYVYLIKDSEGNKVRGKMAVVK